MYGLNRSFQLKASGFFVRGRLRKKLFRLFHQRRRPKPRILLGKRNITSVRGAPGGPSRFTVQHESQQPLNLWFVRHELEKYSGKPDSFFGEAASALIGAN